MDQKRQKKIAAINDLTGYGRCALAVSIPVISHMKIQCCPVPTSILSNHAGYAEYFFDDYTDRLPQYLDMWKRLELSFDGIMSGFLGSEYQIGMIEKFMDGFGSEETVVVVDPVMGDHGRPYRTYTPEMCRAMASLAELAGVITPNRTEAAILLDVPYGDPRLDTEADCRRWAEALSLEGRRSVVLTGAAAEPGSAGAVCFDRTTGRTGLVSAPLVEGSFHGTGDLFASVLTGALVLGESLEQAAARAAEFVSLCAGRTRAAGTPVREGVVFEDQLWRLNAPSVPAPDSGQPESAGLPRTAPGWRADR